MRRLLGLFLIVGLLIGGATACGSSGGGSDDKPASTDSGGDNGGDASSNKDVQAYCDAVDEYVQHVEDAAGDTSKMADLQSESQDLADKAAALGTADLSADDAQTVADCTQKSVEAATS